MTHHLNRRAILAALPASGVALSTLQLAHAQEKDPIIPIYHEWLATRREWRRLSELPGNEDLDDPRSKAAEKRETILEDQMLQLRPTTLEGVGALAALAWGYINPGQMDPDECFDCRIIVAIWQACTGKEGYPEI